MYYVYILRLNNSQFYTGFTSDLKRRISEHKSGRCSFTSQRLPVELIYYEAYKLENDARTRESYLKTSDGRKDIKRQLKYYLKDTELVRRATRPAPGG